MLGCALVACGRFRFADHDGSGVADDASGADGTPDSAQRSCATDSDCALCERCAGNTCAAEPVNSIALGHRSTCFLGANNSRWCIGEDAGIGTPTNVAPFVPRRIVGEDGWTSLVLGYSDSYGLRDTSLEEWNDDAAPTIIDATPASETIEIDTFDTAITTSTGIVVYDGATIPGTWVSASAGNGFACGVQSGGTLWCWGTSNQNCLGQQLADGTVIAAPAQVGVATDWASASVGDGLGCAIKTDHTVWCWGAANYTGTNTVDTMGTPTQISADTDWTGVRVRWQHGCAFKANGVVQCWGADIYGLDLSDESMYVAVPSDAVSGVTFAQFEMGGHHFCAIPNGSTAWRCWGWNAAGQLGNGDDGDRFDYSSALPLCQQAPGRYSRAASLLPTTVMFMPI